MGFWANLFGSSDKKLSREARNFVREAENYVERRENADKAAALEGEHYTRCVERVKDLKRQGRHDEAIALLLGAVDAVEREAKVMGKKWAIAPWYYMQLAIVYRKEKRYADEIEILERFKRADAKTERPGAAVDDRIAKARALMSKQQK